MNGTEAFKAVINTYLQELSLNDLAFAEAFKKANKNIDDCSTYILTEVQKTGQNGFADDEVYKMAIKYYNDDSIEITEIANVGRVVVNHHIPYVRPAVTHTPTYKPKTSVKAQTDFCQTSLF